MAFSGGGKGGKGGLEAQRLYHGVRRILKICVGEVSSGTTRPPAATDAWSSRPVPSRYRCRWMVSSRSWTLPWRLARLHAISTLSTPMPLHFAVHNYSPCLSHRCSIDINVQYVMMAVHATVRMDVRLDQSVERGPVTVMEIAI